MIRKKSKFFTFIFSFLPGAGEMYLGFMRQGVSLMTLFFAVVCIASFLNIAQFLIVVPVIWFYSFFHVHNLRGMPDEEFYEVHDEYLFVNSYTFMPKGKEMDKKIRTAIAAGAIIIGVSILWDNFVQLLFWIFPSYMNDYLYSFIYNIPRLLIAILLVIFGVFLIRGKKKEMNQMKMETGGGQNES